MNEHDYLPAGFLACEPSWARQHFAALKAERGAALAGGRGAERKQSPEQKPASIAIIHVTGLLLPRTPWWSWFGGVTGMDRLSEQLDQAAASSTIAGIALRVFSGGGDAAGIGDVAAKIRSIGKIKPTWAYLDMVTASGAYWLASAAGRVFASENTEVGSIGAFVVLDDLSEAFSKAGIKTKIVKSARFKAIGVSGSTITEDEIGELQRRVDGLHALFVTAVATGRGRAAREIEKVADGRMMWGRQALAVGLIDELGTWEGMLAAFRRELGPGPGAEQVRVMDPAEVGRRVAMGESRKQAIEAGELGEDGQPYQRKPRWCGGVGGSRR